MPTEAYKPIVFISYAQADEQEKPTEGEFKWLSFVTGYLRPAETRGAVKMALERQMRGGEDWNPQIEHTLRKCDIFLLLVSRNSLSSDYVVKEIAIVLDRQGKGEDVHFYPLILSPTPKIALDMVRDKNLRPRDGKPLSSYSLNERDQQMSDVADEIAEIAKEIAGRKAYPSAPSPPARAPRELARAEPVVFLVYSSEDQWAVNQLRNELEANGIRVWSDRQNLRVGDRWKEVLYTIINEKVDYTIVVQTPAMASAIKGVFHLETEVAENRQAQMGEVAGRRLRFLIPVKIGDRAPVSSLSELHSIDVGKPDGVDFLVQSIFEDWHLRKKFMS